MSAVWNETVSSLRTQSLTLPISELTIEPNPESINLYCPMCSLSVIQLAVHYTSILLNVSLQLYSNQLLLLLP
jgi:hypothetical protein